MVCGTMLRPHSREPGVATGSVALVVSLTVALVLSTTGCSKSEPSTEAATPQRLTIFHAGSLAVPFRRLSELYRKQHPGIEVRTEAAGSRDTARKVSDLHRPCDVLASADYRVVENLLLPEHARFNIRFATNEMAIAYTADSTGSAELSAESWPDVLLRDDVTFGRADPNRDPCGYRTAMVFQLAEAHYQRPGLAERLSAKHGKKYLRPKETDLLALLESGELDYVLIYRSVAVQHQLEALELPEEINLKSPSRAAHYAQAKVQVTGRKPGERLTVTGTPINYSVTIPERAPNRAAAEAFVSLLLSPQGQAIMKQSGQPPIVPALADAPERLPPSLARWCAKPHGS